MPEPDWEEVSTLAIKGAQRDAVEAIRDAAIIIKHIGGRNAVDTYLNHTLCELLSVAINEQGQANACQLMYAGLVTAENYTEKTRC
jgi:hypothetical protein